MTRTTPQIETDPDLSDNAAVRGALYSGAIYLLPPTDTSRRLVDEVHDGLRSELGEDPRTAQFRMPGEEFFAAAGRLRRRFYTEPHYHGRVRELLGEFGFDPGVHAFDPIRIRVVTHDGHRDPRAAPIYHGHRDTWYGNPQAQVTWWIPLHDVEPAASFEFYPDAFDRPVHNDSEAFDHDRWVAVDQRRKIGWQDRDTGLEAVYPRLLEAPPGARLPVAARAGQVLLFAGQHLHRTLPNETGRTRFSLDFRAVHVGDHAAGRGAPDVDNRSTGSSLGAHVAPQEP